MNGFQNFQTKYIDTNKSNKTTAKQEVYLPNCEFLMKNESQDKATQNKKVMAKCVQFTIICAPHSSVIPHTPHNCQRAHNKHHFHHGIVQREEISKQIQVPSQKDNRIQLLCLQ